MSSLRKLWRHQCQRQITGTKRPLLSIDRTVYCGGRQGQGLLAAPRFKHLHSGAKTAAVAALVFGVTSIFACCASADLPPGFPNPITFTAVVEGPEGRIERSVELLHAPDGAGGTVYGYYGENATAGGSLSVNGWVPFAGEFSGWLFNGVTSVPWGVVGHVDVQRESFVIESWSGAGVVLVVPEPSSAGAILGVLVGWPALLLRQRRHHRGHAQHALRRAALGPYRSAT
jgi:hypothetical protein